MPLRQTATRQMEALKLDLIGVASALGAPDYLSSLCSADAPQHLQAMNLVSTLQQQGCAARWLTTIQAAHADRLSALATLLQQLAEQTAASLRSGSKPVILGGDHAIAAGTWRGIGCTLSQAPGLIWIDAHLDAHTPATSPTGNPHGMPLAALLGFGSPAMTDIAGPPLQAEQVCLLGARSFEAAELKLLQQLRVRIFSMQEIHQRGLPDVFNDAVAHMGNRPYGISLDLDAIDPRYAPGVNTPVADGLPATALEQALHGQLCQPQCIALEITEYCPARDTEDMTGQLLIRLLASACSDG